MESKNESRLKRKAPLRPGSSGTHRIFHSTNPPRRPTKRLRKSTTVHHQEEEEEEAGETKRGGRGYGIRKINVQEDKIPQPKGATEGILPKHPFRWLIVGASGSGKSNFVANLLSRKDMYRDYFDSVLIISPTALNLDPTYKALKLPTKNFFPCEEGVLERIMELQEEEIEEKKTKAESRRVLVLLDDFISYREFTHSPILLKFAVMSRHWNISMMLLSQAYHRVPKSVRLQMSAITYFKGSNKEHRVLAEDFGAPGMSHKEFISKIEEATDERFSFFFIDLHRPQESRYRKNLEEIIISS